MRNLVPIALLILASIFGFGFTGKKVHVGPVEGLSQGFFGSIQNRWRWPEKVEEGKELLRNSPPLSYTEAGNRLVEKQVALAVLDTLSGEVFEKRVWIRQSDISSDKTRRFEGIELDLDKGYTPDRPVRVEIQWWNSFNSIYRVEPTHYVVVANKYLISSKFIPDFVEHEGKKYGEIIYVPYSEGIHHGQLVEEGKDYLDEVVDRAFEELERDQVKSRFEGKLAIDSVSKDLVKSIIVTEHMDPDLLLVADDGGKMLAERVYIIIGTNKERAYYYTSSTADARGIGQFIRPTYEEIDRKYPDAQLIDDFKLGTSTHSNIVKAMVLLFDNNRYYLGNLLNMIRKDEIDLALAASYNGNPRWVRESILLYGDDWLEHQEVRPILRPETFGYLTKLKSIIGLDFLR